ncbi:response regulator [Segetibacter koreensis]|uniref:response regulator n=1 Tax=Segetibacter koreensis TaxID=398037 RepID=UPI000380AA29|nr:response regulator [Segetibacter koreensis]
MNELQKQVLIIDDDSRNIFALKATLVSQGYTCYTSLTAREGIDLLLQNSGIKIVLMDMMMPEMDGYEAINRIRNNNKLSFLTVIAVTAQAMTGDKEKCLKAGADDYISKPVNVDELLKKLDKF